jgi:hypothetical protein
MAKQNINVGTTANDKKGDSLRAAFVKVNANFTELYAALGLTDVTLNLGAFTFTGSTMSTDDSTNIVIDKPITVNGEITVDGDITPKTNFGASLGTPTKQFKSLYVSTNTVFLGGVPLSLEAGTNELTINNVPISQTINYADIPNVPTDVSDLTDNDGLLGGGGNSFDQDLNTDDSVTFNSVGATTVNVSQINGTNPGDELVIQANNHNWTFDTNGNLTFPQGTLLGYSDPGGFIINGAVDKDIAIYTYNGANAHGWTFGTDGSLTIPGDIKSNGNINIDINLSDSTLRRWSFGEDGSLTLPAGGDILDSNGDSVLGGGSGDTTVVRQDTPPSADNGTLWFNTVEGRLYIKYSDAWIDAAPLMTPAPDTDIDVASITFPDASVQTTAFTGSASTDRLVNGDNELVLESNGNLTIPGAITNDNGIEMTTDRGTVQFGYNLEVPGVASHFHINKVGSFDLFLGDDSDYVKLPSNGGVEIQSGQGLWTFGTDGSLTIPGDITGNNDINITVDSGDSSSYTWNFDRTGDLTAPGDITTGLDGLGGRFIQDCADGTTSMRWINVPQGDDTTQLIRAYTGDPKLNTEVERAQIKLNWDQTEDKSGLTIRTFDQSNPNNEVDHDWLFKGDGVLQLPVGGDIVDSEGNSVLGGSDDNNIWVQTFVSNDPAVDFPNIATGVEYDSEGNVIALFVHTNDLTDERYFTVGKYTAAGTKIWTARLSDDTTTDGWGLAVDNAGGWIYVAGTVDGAGYPHQQATLTKIDAATGGVEWYRIYDFGYDSDSAVVDVDSSGNPVMVGYVDIDPDVFAQESYLAITKVNKTTGAVTWSRKLDGQADEQAYGMAVGPTGEVVAVGYMDQLTGVDTDDRMVVVKYASDGTIAWQRAIQFDAGWTSTGADADIDSQGNVYICGQYTFEFDGGPGSGSAIGIVKLDSSGAKQWSRRVVGDCISLATSIVVGPDDKLYISGVTGNDFENIAYKWLVAKFDFDGLVEWQRFIENTGTWTFSGQFFGGEGGGSNLAVRQGYVALAGGFGDLEAGDEPMAAVIQVSSTGNVFTVGNWNFTSSSLSSTLNSTASDITVINAGLTDSNNVSAITSSEVGITTEVGNFLIGTVLTAPGGNDSLVNGAYLVSLSNTGVVTLPAGGTITEGYVTSNPTIQLTPAAPTVASQKLVIKGGGGYVNIENGITVVVDYILRSEGSTITVYVDSVANADQTLYWWTNPSTANGGVGGTVALDEFGQGSFSFTVDNADYEFKVRVSPEDNNYGPGVIGAQSVLINGDDPTFSDDHHLHLTTGNLTETSIFLGTDDHNVRTTTDGGVEITTPNVSNNVWQFGTDGNLTVPGDIRSEGNINIDINLSDSTLHRWSFGEDGDLTIPATGDIVRDGTSIFASSTALPIVIITDANYNNFDQPVAPATQTTEGAVSFTVTSPVALTATGLLLVSGSNDKGGTIVAGSTATGTQTLVFEMGGYNSNYTVMAFATTANGTSYSAPVAGLGGYVCFPAGTMITLSNGTKKAIEDIVYDDHILVWNFDLGEYASAKPIWIKASETATEYNVLTFSDGSVLKTVGNHHIFNKQAERFTHTMTADTPIGTVTVNEQGEEITLVSAEVVKESVEFYNVWTEYHLNMFAQGVLTSNRFNNTYPIVSMKFVKGNTELRSLAEFNGIDPKWIQGLRLQEQTSEHTAEYIKWYVSERLEKLSINSVEMVA